MMRDTDVAQYVMRFSEVGSGLMVEFDWAARLPGFGLVSMPLLRKELPRARFFDATKDALKRLPDPVDQKALAFLEFAQEELGACHLGRVEVTLGDRKPDGLLDVTVHMTVIRGDEPLEFGPITVTPKVTAALDVAALAVNAIPILPARVAGLTALELGKVALRAAHFA